MPVGDHAGDPCHDVAVAGHGGIYIFFKELAGNSCSRDVTESVGGTFGGHFSFFQENCKCPITTQHIRAKSMTPKDVQQLIEGTIVAVEALFGTLPHRFFESRNLVEVHHAPAIDSGIEIVAYSGHLAAKQLVVDILGQLH